MKNNIFIQKNIICFENTQLGLSKKITMKPQTDSVRAPIYWSTLYGSFDLPTHKTYMNSTTHYGRSQVPTNIGFCCKLPERNKNHYEMIGLPSKHATTCRKLQYHILRLLPLNLLFHHALYYRIIHSTDGRMVCSSVHFTLIYLHLNIFYSLIPCCCSCRFFSGWSIELYNTTHHIDTRSNWSRFGL